MEYVAELAGENPLTTAGVLGRPSGWDRDREDLKDYKVKLSVAFCFSNTTSIIEHYHNSSWLEHGGTSREGGAERLCVRLGQLSEKAGEI